ncbi:MAG TPA: hypothetical protein PK034_04905, partial [Rugosibacter sp.]|nr:hypothetical protein [Rugosibacter sp.]
MNELSRQATLNPIHAPHAACSQCNLQELCLPVGLTTAELSTIDHLVSERRKVARGDALFCSGDHFTAIYAVKLGFFKKEVLSE